MNFYENLTNNLYNFFTCFPEHVERWDATAEKTSTDLKLLLSYSETYIDTTNTENVFANLVSVNEDFTHVQQRTQTAVVMHLEETMMKIRENQDSLYAIVDDLLIKQDAIERAACKLPEIDLACKFYNIPRLSRLREYSEDATKFFQTLYLQIDTAMSNVDYLQTLSIKDAMKMWNQRASSHLHIREILAYITFTNSQNAA